MKLDSLFGGIFWKYIVQNRGRSFPTETLPHSLVYKILVLVRALTFWRFWDWSYKIGGLIAKIVLPPPSFREIML
jgi:hypothetical protein